MSVGREYLQIVLGLRTLVPDWVESYAGPVRVPAPVDATAQTGIEQLRESAHALIERVRDEETDRERSRWLVAQLHAISIALRWREGEQLSYSTLFELCHGASVELVPDRQFDRAHLLLDRALPGHG